MCAISRTADQTPHSYHYASNVGIIGRQYRHTSKEGGVWILD
jgi:hypothetical protein